MEARYQQLRRRFQEITVLGLINSLLTWDQNTYMPSGGAEARGRQSALVATLHHQRLTDDEIGYSIEQLEPWAGSLPYESNEASFVRAARRLFDQAVKIPPALIARAYAHFSHGYQGWTMARPNNDFPAVQPILEETLEISRRIAECFPGYDHIADRLIDRHDYGIRARDLRKIFTELRAELVPLVDAICQQPEIDDSVLRRHYPIDKQRAFGEAIIAAYGYDFARGRQDLTHHPFVNYSPPKREACPSKFRPALQNGG